ncbi:hypothetical protein DZB84_04465 [Bacillus sp. HNG]|uniref:hypothetical protein n=1 Tax=Bacillus sp. HNG TaxID=2293325 RepID=UPI000E2E4537|nr:hypothetical protein [Bacillus sp. HNG]RFB18175.1 hypothetical protein DZB84_04465 [Bacillus sp. HNG]
MGYILPINNEQYTQYVHRTTTYKTNQMKLHQVNPLVLNVNERSYDLHQVDRKTLTKKQSQYIENIRAQFTGEGLLFNESI